MTLLETFEKIRELNLRKEITQKEEVEIEQLLSDLVKDSSHPRTTATLCTYARWKTLEERGLNTEESRISKCNVLLCAGCVANEVGEWGCTVFGENYLPLCPVQTCAKFVNQLQYTQNFADKKYVQGFYVDLLRAAAEEEVDISDIPKP